jgi:hypothetical protein
LTRQTLGVTGYIMLGKAWGPGGEPGCERSGGWWCQGLLQGRGSNFFDDGRWKIASNCHAMALAIDTMSEIFADRFDLAKRLSKPVLSTHKSTTRLSRSLKTHMSGDLFRCSFLRRNFVWSPEVESLRVLVPASSVWKNYPSYVPKNGANETVSRL